MLATRHVTRLFWRIASPILANDVLDPRKPVADSKVPYTLRRLVKMRQLRLENSRGILLVNKFSEMALKCK